MVRNLLAQGVDVFVVDWGNAGPEDAGQGLDHFVGDRIPALVAQTLATAEAENLTLFGICQGGTLAAMHAARDPKGLNGLITAVAPFDFHADAHDADPAHGLLNLWLRALEPEEIEGLLTLDGNMSGDLMGLIFNQLNPVRTLAKYAIDMLDNMGDPTAAATFLAMETWLADRPDLPGAMARTWMIDLYRDNALVAGKIDIEGARINLRDIPAPVLNIFATGDHIIPPPCSRALGAHVQNAQYTELALPSGHIGAFVSAKTQVLLAPAVVSFLHHRRAL
jgi:polyhydroxyalkanoate synthase